MGVMDTSLPFLTDAAGKPKRYPLNDYYRTPNMERLAARGIRFNNFCAMSVCSPTRISIMTGQNAARHRTTNWINPDKDNAGPQGPPDWNWQGLKKGDVTLAGLLQAGGYRTIHVGKGHFGPREFEGADPRTSASTSTSPAPPSARRAATTASRTSAPAKARSKRRSRAVPGLEKYHGQDTFLTEALTLEAKAHVGDAVKAEKPFFLYFAHYAVHAPFNSDPRFAAHYKDSGKPAARPGLRHADRRHGQVARRPARSSRRARRRREHAHLLPRRQRLRRAARPSARSRLRRSAARQEGLALRRRHARALHRRLGEAGCRQRPSEAPAHRRGAIQSQQAAVYDLFPTILGSRGSGIRPPNTSSMAGARHAARRQARPQPATRHFLMHYPHAPHRTDYFTSLPRWRLEGHLPLLPLRGLRRHSLPALQPQGRPLRAKEPRHARIPPN